MIDKSGKSQKKRASLKSAKSSKKVALKRENKKIVAKQVTKIPAMKVSRNATKPTLLSGGNPQIAKADGDIPVQAYIEAMPDWKREIGRRLDALIVRLALNVRKAVKWNTPLYGIEGQGWFIGFHVFTRFVKVTFFRGTS